MKKLGLTLIGVFLIAVTLSWAAEPTTDTATVCWEPVIANTDGSVITDLIGYRVYYGTAPDNYSGFVEVNKDTLCYQFTGLSDNTKYHYRITAFDVVSIHSDKSNEVSRTINFTIAKAPVAMEVVGP